MGREIERERKWGDSEEHYIWGERQEKVPRQCPLVLLVEVMHMFGINFFMTLEELHCSEISSNI
jgi:hypothetical protein